MAELSTQQLEVLGHISHGLTNKEIGKAMGLSPETVRDYIYVIVCKITAKNRVHAVRRGFELGLLS